MKTGGFPISFPCHSSAPPLNTSLSFVQRTGRTVLAERGALDHVRRIRPLFALLLGMVIARWPGVLPRRGRRKLDDVAGVMGLPW